MKAKKWIIGWLALILVGLGTMGAWVYRVDPYMHFHKPDTETYFYSLNNQRSQNSGIVKNFDYTALIAGTSMTENFKASEADRIFDVKSIKVSSSGCSYKEANEYIETGLNYNSSLKTIIRCLDMGMFLDDADRMRTDLGKYPTYLFDDNPFNDVEYLFNRDVIWNRVYPMTVANDAEDFHPGITSFDDYARWQLRYTFGINTVAPDGVAYAGLGSSTCLTDEEKHTIEHNIGQNVTSIADQYPNVDFYYYFSPYSILWWKEQAETGTINKQLEAEQYIIELILPHNNIHLHSFNNRTDIITDLNNYKDKTHYGEWINSAILKWMHDGKYLLSEDNYLNYLEEEKHFFTNFDYNSLNGQVDYEDDFYAGAKINKELTGAESMDVFEAFGSQIILNSSSIVENEIGEKEIQCIGSLNRESGGEALESYLLNREYIGAKIEIENIGDFNYLVFEGKKNQDHGEPTVYAYDADGKCIAKVEANYKELDSEWHRYTLDLSRTDGAVTIIINGGYIANTGNEVSNYSFKNVYLY